MTRRLRNALILFIVLAFSPPLVARGDMSLDQAVRQARDKSNGRLISAETQEKNGQRVHNIRILTDDGKVRRFRYDAGGDRRNKKH
jgi:hypothetical protein